jgi:hypothetical protein
LRLGADAGEELGSGFEVAAFGGGEFGFGRDEFAAEGFGEDGLGERINSGSGLGDAGFEAVGEGEECGYAAHDLPLFFEGGGSGIAQFSSMGVSTLRVPCVASFEEKSTSGPRHLRTRNKYSLRSSMAGIRAFRY